MIVDSSALLAILLNESEASLYFESLQTAGAPLISAVNYVEVCAVVGDPRNVLVLRQFETLMARLNIAVEPVTLEQAAIARDAYRDFGKGRHPAALNLADTFAYALAKAKDAPLLFKGNDFSRTDVKRA